MTARRPGRRGGRDAPHVRPAPRRRDGPRPASPRPADAPSRCSPASTAASGLGGDAEWFGVSTAILAGDLAVRRGPINSSMPRHSRPARSAACASVRRAAHRGDDRSVPRPASRPADVGHRGRGAARGPAEVGALHRHATARARPAPWPADDRCRPRALREYGDVARRGVPDPRRRARPVRRRRPHRQGPCRGPARGQAHRARAARPRPRLAGASAPSSSTTSAPRVVSDRDAERCCEVIADCGALASVESLIDALHRRAIDAVDGLRRAGALRRCERSPTTSPGATR